MVASNPLLLVRTDAAARLLLALAWVLLSFPALSHAEEVEEEAKPTSSLRLVKQLATKLVLAQVPAESIPAGTTESTETSSNTDCSPLPIDSPLVSLTVDITPRVDGAPTGELPVSCPSYSLSNNSLQHWLGCGLSGSCAPYCWDSARFCHKPLYFEEWCLERCGETYCCRQPLISGLNFFGGVVILPLKMWQHSPCRCVRTPACY